MRHFTMFITAALLLLATRGATASGGEQIFSAYYDTDDLPRLVVRADATSIDWRGFEGEIRVYRDRRSREGGRDYTAFPASPLTAGGEIPIRVPSIAWLKARSLHVELWRSGRRGHTAQETRVRVLDIPLLVPPRPETLVQSPDADRRTDNTDPAAITPGDGAAAADDIAARARLDAPDGTRSRSATPDELAPPPCPSCGPGSRDEGPLDRIPARPGLTDAVGSLPAPVRSGGSGPSGDLDLDGDTDASDLAALIMFWGPCLQRLCPGDLNGDFRIDTEDLLLLLVDFDG